MQKVLLYHNALSEGVEVKDVLSYVRETKKKNDTLQINLLKEKLAAQEASIQLLVAQQQQLFAAQHKKESSHRHHSAQQLSVPSAAKYTVSDGIGSSSYHSGLTELEMVNNASNGRRNQLPPTHNKPNYSVSQMPIPPLKLQPMVAEEEVDDGPVSILRNSPRVVHKSGLNSPVVHKHSAVDSLIGKVFSPKPPPHTSNNSSGGSLLEERTLGVAGSVEVSGSVAASPLGGSALKGSYSSGKRVAAPPVRASSWLEQESNVSNSPATAKPVQVTAPDFSFAQPASLPPR